MDQSGFHTNFTLEEIEHSVIEFLKMIDNLSTTAAGLEDLSDGLILTELLSKINSTQFDLSRIERDTDGNWALNHKNVTFLVKSLEQYYHEILKVSDFEADMYLDVMEISQNKNKLEIIKLVELVLGVIVQSEQKNDFIHAITQLERKSQAVLMHLMEKWIVQERLNSHEGMNINDDAFSIESMNSSRLSTSGIHYNTQAFQPNQQLAIVLKKIDELERENDVLLDRVENQKNEIIDKDRRIIDFEREVLSKDDEIKKLKLSKDSLMLSLGLNLADDNIESIVRDKDLKIEQLNQLIEGLHSQAADEKVKLEDEISLLGKKLKQLQKSSESMEFYKEKYVEFTQLQEKYAEADKKAKSFDKVLSEKDAQIEMLKEKLQEFKTSYNDERKKAMSKTIEVSEKENLIEQLRRDNDVLERKYHVQEEKLQDVSQILERMQHEESQTSFSLGNPATRNGGGSNNNVIGAADGVYGNDNLSVLMKNNMGQGGSNDSMIPKGLNEDLSQIISDLQRENLLLKHEQNTSNILDMSHLNLEDVSSLKESIELLQKKLEQVSREKLDLEAKVAQYAKLDVEKVKEENEKLKADYHGLLAKAVTRKERMAAETIEESVKSMQEEIVLKEQEIERVVKCERDAQAKLQVMTEAKVKLEESYQMKVKEMGARFDIIQEQLSESNQAKDAVEKKLKSQNQTFKVLFDNKNEELEILYGVLCEMRTKYYQVTQRDRSAVKS